MSRIVALANESPEGVGAAELPRPFQVSAAVINKELRALEQKRCLERGPATGRFHVGPTLALLRVPRIQVLARHARPELERRRDQLDETTNLAVLDGRCLDVHSLPTRRLVRFVLCDVEQSLLLCTACGSAALSLLPASRTRDLLRLPADSRPADLRAFEEVRIRGYAIDDRERRSRRQMCRGAVARHAHRDCDQRQCPSLPLAARPRSPYRRPSPRSCPCVRRPSWLFREVISNHGSTSQKNKRSSCSRGRHGLLRPGVLRRGNKDAGSR